MREEERRSERWDALRAARGGGDGSEGKRLARRQRHPMPMATHRTRERLPTTKAGVAGLELAEDPVVGRSGIANSGIVLGSCWDPVVGRSGIANCVSGRLALRGCGTR